MIKGTNDDTQLTMRQYVMHEYGNLFREIKTDESNLIKEYQKT